MALISLGQATCVLCGKLLMEGEDILGLPPTADKEHPLYKYFDSGLHSECFENWNKKQEALIIVEEDKQRFINSDYFKEMVSKYGRPKWLDE